MYTRIRNIIPALIILLNSIHSSPQAFSYHADSTRPEPKLAKPKPGIIYDDPVFGTPVKRITDAKKQKAPGIFPQYSKRQAWNSDESLLLLLSDDGSTRLYNGKIFEFIKMLDGVGGEDIFWDPNDKNRIIFTSDNNIYSYDIRTDKRSLIKNFPAFSFINTRGEGNLSANGISYAFVGQLYDSKTETVIFKNIILYDLKTNRQVSELSIPKGIENFDWVSVSPSGNYIVIDYADQQNAAFHGLEVYDRTFHRLWQKGLGPGHSDLAVDTDGSDVLIMDCYDENLNKTFIKKFRLSDGKETILFDVSPFFDLHISCRNENQKGWCIISTFDYVEKLETSPGDWLPYENEIFALKMDGSYSVQRIAHHHSRRYSPATPDSDRSVYWAEPHATISRSGKFILWGSNWGEDVSNIENVDVYLGQPQWK